MHEVLLQVYDNSCSKSIHTYTGTKEIHSSRQVQLSKDVGEKGIGKEHCNKRWTQKASHGSSCQWCNEWLVY